MADTDRLAAIRARDLAAQQMRFEVSLDHYSGAFRTEGERDLYELARRLWNQRQQARDDVPFLLAEVRRLNGEVAELAAENQILERGLGLNEAA